MKDREVKCKARVDKRVWLDRMGDEEEKYAENGRTRELYQTAKIKDKNARLERWAEHFEEVLVREAPTNPVKENEVETDEIREMDTTEIREAEVRQALKNTKIGENTWN